MKLRLEYPVKKIDQSAYGALTNFILTYLNRNVVSTIEIGKDKVVFRKLLFKCGELKYSDYDLDYRDGVIYYIGNEKFDLTKWGEIRTVLINILYHAKPGFLYPF